MNKDIYKKIVHNQALFKPGTFHEKLPKQIIDPTDKIRHYRIKRIQEKRKNAAKSITG